MVESNLIETEIGLAALYAEFADEDQKLAEEGLSDYNEGLTKEEYPMIVKVIGQDFNIYYKNLDRERYGLTISRFNH